MKQDPVMIIELFQFCEAYNIKPRHSAQEIAIWKLVYAHTGHDVCFVTYIGTFEEATVKLLRLAKKNNNFMPSQTGYLCTFHGFRIDNSCCKISQGLAQMIRDAGGYIRDENIDT